MSDRELLELAAKAAGYQFSTSMRSLSRPPVPVILAESGRWKQWDPLHDDGDAFRLAVDLQLCTSTGDLACAASWPPHSAWLHEVVEKHDGDKRAAMRRAITRAAAEIGRQMG